MTALRWAVSTFTALPAGRFVPQRRSAGAAMLLGPVAVVPLALVAVGVAALAVAGVVPPLLAAVAIVAVLAAGTRAMHLDALADVADALGGGWTATRAREILRRGDVGPMGVVALVLCLVAQVAALQEVVHDLPAVGVAVVVSRCAVTIACRRGVPGMTGSRLGILVAGSVPRPAVVASLALGTALLAAVNPWAVVVAGITWLVVWALVRHACRRFDGVNGDVMGTAVEVAFTCLVVGLAVLPA